MNKPTKPIFKPTTKREKPVVLNMKFEDAVTRLVKVPKPKK